MQAVEAVAGFGDRGFVMTMPVVASACLEVFFDLLEEFVELVQRGNAAVAQLVE